MPSYTKHRGALIGSLLAVTSCGGGSGGGAGAGIVVPPPPPPASINTAPVFSSLSFAQSVAMLQAPGDSSRWFVVERAGVVRVFDNQSNVTSSSVFADISTLVDSGSQEAGLLGMAFHPDFANNGEVFLSFTVTGNPLTSRIDRFMSNDGGATLDVANSDTLLTAAQLASNHNGGYIAFGPDGFLYAGFGDGGGGGDPGDNGQDPTNVLGSIIRIDVDGGVPYAIPTNNPFAGNPLCASGAGAANCPETFAYGLRNPWRWSFDRQTGDLFAGDVGQGSFEEIDRITNGGNFGWNIREGANCFEPPSGCTTAGLSDPIHEYGRDLGASVTGGFVYRGSAISSLVGRYVFGDFVSGRIWSIDAAAQGLVQSDELVDTALSIASFAESLDGELYIVDLGGSLHQLVEN